MPFCQYLHPDQNFVYFILTISTLQFRDKYIHTCHRPESQEVTAVKHAYAINKENIIISEYCPEENFTENIIRAKQIHKEENINNENGIKKGNLKRVKLETDGVRYSKKQ